MGEGDPHPRDPHSVRWNENSRKCCCSLLKVLQRCQTFLSMYIDRSTLIYIYIIYIYIYPPTLGVERVGAKIGNTHFTLAPSFSSV